MSKITSLDQNPANDLRTQIEATLQKKFDQNLKNFEESTNQALDQQLNEIHQWHDKYFKDHYNEMSQKHDQEEQKLQEEVFQAHGKAYCQYDWSAQNKLRLSCDSRHPSTTDCMTMEGLHRHKEEQAEKCLGPIQRLQMAFQKQMSEWETNILYPEYQQKQQNAQDNAKTQLALKSLELQSELDKMLDVKSVEIEKVYAVHFAHH